MKIAFSILCLALLSSCQSNQPLEPSPFYIDVTEDFHHRMQSGALNLQKEPLVIAPLSNDQKSLVKMKNSYLRMSWELGSFWVKSNEESLVVMYWNSDVIYGHVQIASAEQGSTFRHFLPNPIHPVQKTF